MAQLDPDPRLLPPFGCIEEPALRFHSVRGEDHHIHPLHGLLEYGPFSRSYNWVFDPIKIAVVCPFGFRPRVDQLLRELEAIHSPVERKEYLPEYPGFARIFGVRAVVASGATVELPKELSAQVNQSKGPHLVLSQALATAVSSLQATRSSFDVVLILLAEEWESAFTGPEGEDFDLHDFIKALTATLNIPAQIVLEQGALRYRCRCSVMWTLAIAMYSKAGGIPWKLANRDTSTAYIGLGYALKSGKTEHRFVTSCSQVFDADGAGLDFLAYETDDIRVDRENPFLSREDTFKLINRSLTLYQGRHAGRLPSRVVIHKSSEFKAEEVDGCFDAWLSPEGLELIQIQQSTPWFGIKFDRPQRQGLKSSAAFFPIDRGTFLPLTGLEALLWTQGNARGVVNNGNYFKEKNGVPHPILVRRFGGHGGWTEICNDILALSKMNWNSDGLYDRLPVTLTYAHILARTIKRIPQISPRPYQFRFFM